MWRKLRFKLACTMALLGFVGSISLNAQVSDATGNFTTPLTGAADVVYAAVVYNDGDNDGVYDALFAVAGMPILGWGDYSANVIFYADGIVVENGSTEAGATKFLKNATPIIPVPNQLYHIWMVFNFPAQTYKAYIQTDGMPQPIIVSDVDAVFVNKTISSLTNWAAIHNGDSWSEPNDKLTVQKVSTEYPVGTLPPEIADSKLSSLTVSVGSLVPAFDPAVLDYSVEVPFGTPSVTITAEAGGVGAKVEGAGVVALEDGFAYSIITVTAGNGEKTEYAIEISEAGAASDASLKSIGVSAGALDPLFHRDVFTYNLIVPVGTASVDLTAAATAGGSTVTGTGNYPLVGGTAKAEIKVTSLDLSTTTTYTVNIAEADGNNYALSLPGGATGATSNVAIPALGLTSLPYTIEMWFKPESYNSLGGLWIDRSGAAVTGLQYDGTTNYLRFDYGGTSRIVTLTNAIPVVNSWNHVAAIVTETSIKIVLNGVEFETTGLANTQVPFTGTSYIGYDPAVANRTLKGAFDEIRIWNTARTTQELLDNKYTVYTGAEANLIGYWNFDLKNNVLAVETAGGNKHGGINGGTYTGSFPRADLDLATLSVTPGTMYPAFNGKVNTYHLVLPKGTTSFDVAATASNGAAVVSGTGTINVTGNIGQATVSVKTADGKYSNDYVINYKLEVDLTLKHQYKFDDGTANDNVGTAHGTINGGVVADGMYTTTTNGQHISLPGSTIAINTYPAITLELYVKTPVQNDGNRMITYFGNTGTTTWGNDYLFTSHKSRAAISCGSYGAPWGAENGVSGALLEDNGNHHLVCTLTNSEIGWYIDGVSAGTKAVLSDANKIHNLSNVFAYICKSGYNDKTWLGSVNEYNIYAGIMDDATILLHSKEVPTKVQGVNASGISVFPTKSNGNFTVAANGSETSVTVIDITGKTVARQVSQAASQTVNITKAGLYVLKIESGNQVKMVKVIVTK